MTFNYTANIPPSLEGPQIFFINVGQESTYTFTVTDDRDKFTLTIENTLEGAYVQNNGSLHTIRWLLSADDLPSFNQTIRIIARDDLNATSLLIPQLQICACNSQGGNCTLAGLIDIASNPLILNCQCTPGEPIIVISPSIARL